MPDALTFFGPLNHPLDLQLEATYGYNPLELAAYAEYRAASATNLKLRDGLGVARYLDRRLAAVVPNVAALPRAYFAAQVIPAADSRDARGKLATLGPARSAVVEGPAPEAQADPSATAAVTEDGNRRIGFGTGA